MYFIDSRGNKRFKITNAEFMLFKLINNFSFVNESQLNMLWAICKGYPLELHNYILHKWTAHGCILKKRAKTENIPRRIYTLTKAGKDFLANNGIKVYSESTAINKHNEQAIETIVQGLYCARFKKYDLNLTNEYHALCIYGVDGEYNLSTFSPFHLYNSLNNKQDKPIRVSASFKETGILNRFIKHGYTNKLLNSEYKQETNKESTGNPNRNKWQQSISKLSFIQKNLKTKYKQQPSTLDIIGQLSTEITNSCLYYGVTSKDIYALLHEINLVITDPENNHQELQNIDDYVGYTKSISTVYGNTTNSLSDKRTSSIRNNSPIDIPDKDTDLSSLSSKDNNPIKDDTDAASPPIVPKPDAFNELTSLLSNTQGSNDHSFDIDNLYSSLNKDLKGKGKGHRSKKNRKSNTHTPKYLNSSTKRDSIESIDSIIKKLVSKKGIIDFNHCHGDALAYYLPKGLIIEIQNKSLHQILEKLYHSSNLLNFTDDELRGLFVIALLNIVLIKTDIAKATNNCLDNQFNYLNRDFIWSNNMIANNYLDLEKYDFRTFNKQLGNQFGESREFPFESDMMISFTRNNRRQELFIELDNRTESNQIQIQKVINYIWYARHNPDKDIQMIISVTDGSLPMPPKFLTYSNVSRKLGSLTSALIKAYFHDKNGEKIYLYKAYMNTPNLTIKVSGVSETGVDVAEFLLGSNPFNKQYAALQSLIRTFESSGHYKCTLSVNSVYRKCTASSVFMNYDYNLGGTTSTQFEYSHAIKDPRLGFLEITTLLTHKKAKVPIIFGLEHSLDTVITQLQLSSSTTQPIVIFPPRERLLTSICLSEFKDAFNWSSNYSTKNPLFIQPLLNGIENPQLISELRWLTIQYDSNLIKMYQSGNLKKENTASGLVNSWKQESQIKESFFEGCNKALQTEGQNKKEQQYLMATKVPLFLIPIDFFIKESKKWPNSQSQPILNPIFEFSNVGQLSSITLSKKFKSSMTLEAFNLNSSSINSRSQINFYY